MNCESFIKLILSLFPLLDVQSLVTAFLGVVSIFVTRGPFLESSIPLPALRNVFKSYSKENFMRFVGQHPVSVSFRGILPFVSQNSKNIYLE